MHEADARHWRLALDELGRMLDLDPVGRERRLEHLGREAPALATTVAALLSADAPPSADGAAEVPPSREPVIPGYRILGLIGRGGAGDVFEAERQVDGLVQRVALKSLRIGEDAAHRARFMAERQVLAQLQHPGIARLLDAGIDSRGCPWMAMELVQGHTLSTHAARNLHEVESRLRIFLAVCRVVEHAHRHMTLHCDLKPGNIMIDDGGEVKLLDFGIARLLGEGRCASATVSMTPEYAAPEQLLGEPLSVATDVYALGTILLELLVGNLPSWSLRDRMRQAMSVEEEVLRPSVLAAMQPPEQAPGGPAGRSRWLRSLHGDLDAIVVKARWRDPQRRYADVHALAEDVQRHLQGLPILTRSDDLWYLCARFVRRHLGAIAVGAILILLLSTSAVFALHAAARAEQALISAQAEHERATAEARNATQVKDFLVSMLDDVDPLTLAGNAGKEYPAAELLLSASRRIDTANIDSPLSRAEILNEIAGGLRSLGRPKEALVHADRAVDLAREQEASMVLARALYTRGSILNALGRLEEAQRDGVSGLDTLAAMGPVDLPRARDRELSLRSLLGAIALARDDVPAAREQGERVLKTRIAMLGSADDPSLASEWHNLGRVNLQLAEYEAAESDFRHALALSARASQGPRVAWQHEGLGRALLAQGRLEEASVHIDAAWDIASRRLEPGHMFLGNIRSSMGGLALARGDAQQALRYHREAAQMHRDNPVQRHVDEVNILLALMVMQRDGAARQALATARDTQATLSLRPGSPWVSMADLCAAILAVRAGQAQARGEAEAAMARIAAGWGGVRQLNYVRAQQLMALIDERPRTLRATEK